MQMRLSAFAAVSGVVAPALMAYIKQAAVTDTAYFQSLIARAEHLGLLVRDELVYSLAGLLYIPMDEAIRATLMREVHDTPTGGHLGREKTYSRLTAHVYWQGVYNDVRDYVRSCVSCAQNKAHQHVHADVLHSLPIPARRWETISLDCVGPLPKTSRGHDFLLVVVDKFSKLVHLIACTQQVTAAVRWRCWCTTMWCGCMASRRASSATATRASPRTSGVRCGSCAARSSP